MKIKLNRTTIILAVCIISTIFKIYYANLKNIPHGDEILSHTLTHSNDPFLKDKSLHSRWLDKKQILSYVITEKNSFSDLKKIYLNQVYDVHPPLYYYLIKIFTLNSTQFSKWPGTMLNLLFSLISIIYLFKIMEYFKVPRHKIFLSLIVINCSTFAISLTLYIRMYEILSALMIIFTYLLINLSNRRNYYKMSLIVALSLLTHYFSCIYLGISFLVYSFKNNPNKVLKLLASLASGTIIAVLVFPKMLSHILSGYRGTEAMSRFSELGEAALSEKLLEFYNLTISGFSIGEIIIPLLLANFLISLILTRKSNKYIYSKVFSVFIVTTSTIAFALIVSPYPNMRYIIPFFPLFLLSLLVLSCRNNINYYTLLLILSINIINPNKSLSNFEESNIYSFLVTNKIKRSIILIDDNFKKAEALPILLKSEQSMILFEKYTNLEAILNKHTNTAVLDYRLNRIEINNNSDFLKRYYRMRGNNFILYMK